MDDIVCNRCSLLCDDGLAEITGEGAKSLGLCHLGHTHLETMAHQISTDAISREGGKETNLSVEEALKMATELLISAENPLLYGWTRSTNETINEGINLAKTVKGIFDSSVNMGLLQSIKHNIHKMKLEIILEDVLNNGEFILYWGSNPVESSHRHASRFTVFPRGQNIPQGVESRIIGVVDVRETETMKMANHRIIIKIGKDKELANGLIAELKGAAQSKSSVAGLPTTTLIGLSQAFRKSDYIVIFYGSGIVNSDDASGNLSAIAELIQTLRGMGKKAFALPMWHESNDMGIANAMIKAKIDDDKDASTLTRLSRGDFDVVLVVNSDPLISLPNNAAKGMAKTKLIYIGPEGGITENKAQLALRVADDIISGKGTMTRVDMKEIPLKVWRDKQPSNTAFEIITQLHQMILKKNGS